MLTDPIPRRSTLRRQFEASEERTTLPLPEAAPLQEAARELDAALERGLVSPVQRAGVQVLDVLAAFYDVRRPTLSVLGVRPHQTLEGHLTYELFGDYAPGSEKIRVWMRTAILGKVTSYRGLLNTLLHEFCHHLDVRKLGFDETPHTRGFYARIDELYHLALATPPERRKPLAWRRVGGVWTIDWAKMRAPKAR